MRVQGQKRALPEFDRARASANRRNLPSARTMDAAFELLSGKLIGQIGRTVGRESDLTEVPKRPQTPTGQTARPCCIDLQRKRRGRSSPLTRWKGDGADWRARVRLKPCRAIRNKQQLIDFRPRRIRSRVTAIVRSTGCPDEALRKCIVTKQMSHITGDGETTLRSWKNQQNFH